MLKPSIEYRCLGSKAFEIYWTVTDQDILTSRHAIAKTIQQYYGAHVAVNEGYQSLLVLILDAHLQLVDVIQTSKELLSNSSITTESEVKNWKIPVCYNLASDDIKEVSALSGLSISNIIDLHSTQIFRVEFIGFLTGFPYFSGLPLELYIPRKSTPSKSISKGSVAIAAGQCGIYPQDSPGGWYVLGNTPLSLFDVNNQSPNLFEIGDTVSFYQIDAVEHEKFLSRPLSIEKYVDG